MDSQKRFQESNRQEYGSLCWWYVGQKYDFWETSSGLVRGLLCFTVPLDEVESFKICCFYYIKRKVYGTFG